MSRYPVPNYGVWHYLGGVDQFDVFYITSQYRYALVWGHIFMHRDSLSISQMQTPDAIFDYCDVRSNMTMEQAERICLLVKLFGPKETQ